MNIDKLVGHVAHASKRWRSTNCPGCQEEGLGRDTLELTDEVTVRTFQCMTPECRVITYMGPREGAA